MFSYLFLTCHNEKRSVRWTATIDTDRTRHLSSNDCNSPRCVDSHVQCSHLTRNGQTSLVMTPMRSAQTFSLVRRYHFALYRDRCYALYLDNCNLWHISSRNDVTIICLASHLEIINVLLSHKYSKRNTIENMID